LPPLTRFTLRYRLVKSNDFSFGFCIPSSTNSWDSVYALPPLEDSLINDMIESEFQTTSDSFYFVGEELVMHNKASYRYTVEDRAQSKRSYDGRYESKGGSGDAKAESKGGAESKSSGAKGGNDDKEGPWSKAADYE